ncbi:MAG: hypothetical protein HKN50_11855 [Gammaproteobacteria bacterium]|nr:hypothetical protein [Gammaproteobacteria bacterium]RZV49587.1 MAG: hypothetical protein EX270_12410 [Pseudomonadales bacterium]
MIIRNNVLLISDDQDKEVSGSMSLDRDTLNRIAANMLSWPTALEEGKIETSQGGEVVAQLLSLIE